jgi:uncharacterized protein (TIGR02421 family)
LKVIRKISNRLIVAQSKIRILDAIKWRTQTKIEFFKKKCLVMPKIDRDYYNKIPLPFKVNETIDEFYQIIRDARNQLGQYSTITTLIEHRALDYIEAIRMLLARGTPGFSNISKRLYGSPNDVFYVNGPKLSELGNILGDTLQELVADLSSKEDQKDILAPEALSYLRGALSSYFSEDKTVTVKINDQIVADAAAGADYIKLNKNSRFSHRDLKYLEVHEGWVHVGTTLNGRAQPYCTFLEKGPPCSTVTQEGLAVIMELFTFNSSPQRLLKITNRVKAIALANQGANFLDVYSFYLEQTDNPEEAYNFAMRVFRGSTAELGPFTKDLSYIRGFLLIYNYLRLAAKKGLIKHAQLLFCGKVMINELKYLYVMQEQGIVLPAKYIPPQFSDLASISSWMSLSLFLNKFDLNAMEKHYNLF